MLKSSLKGRRQAGITPLGSNSLNRGMTNSPGGDLHRKVAAVRGWRRRRAAQDEAGRKLDMVEHGPSGDPVEQIIGGAPAELLGRHDERGERRVEVRGRLEIVEAGDLDPGRHPDAPGG